MRGTLRPGHPYRLCALLCALWCTLLFGACSIVLGEEPLDVVPEDTPAPKPLELEGNGRLRDTYFLVGPDGAPWVAVAQTYQRVSPPSRTPEDPSPECCSGSRSPRWLGNGPGLNAFP